MKSLIVLTSTLLAIALAAPAPAPEATTCTEEQPAETHLTYLDPELKFRSIVDEKGHTFALYCRPGKDDICKILIGDEIAGCPIICPLTGEFDD